MIVDSHAHLEMPAFADDLPAVLERARASGVERIVTVATTPEDLARVLEIAGEYPEVAAAAGFHPHEASRITLDHMDRLRLAAGHLSAIGETGLDYFKMHSPKEDQRRVFAWHLDLAQELGKPVIVHLRQDVEDFVDIAGPRLMRLRGVVHCYSGTYALAKKLIDAGWCISVPGTITYPANNLLREIIKKVPLASMMVETDCPYLAPVPYRGQRNEPSYVPRVVKAIAELKDLSMAKVAEMTSATATRFFGL